MHLHLHGNGAMATYFRLQPISKNLRAVEVRKHEHGWKFVLEKP